METRKNDKNERKATSVVSVIIIISLLSSFEALMSARNFPKRDNVSDGTLSPYTSDAVDIPRLCVTLSPHRFTMNYAWFTGKNSVLR